MKSPKTFTDIYVVDAESGERLGLPSIPLAELATQQGVCRACRVRGVPDKWDVDNGPKSILVRVRELPTTLKAR